MAKATNWSAVEARLATMVEAQVAQVLKWRAHEGLLIVPVEPIIESMTFGVMAQLRTPLGRAAVAGLFQRHYTEDLAFRSRVLRELYSPIKEITEDGAYLGHDRILALEIAEFLVMRIWADGELRRLLAGG